MVGYNPVETCDAGRPAVPLIAALTLVIQGFFIYHVFKTGRPYWWAFIIFSFPILGCVIYYFVEMFPTSREATSARRKTRQLVRAMNPDADLKRRVEDLEVCGSTENRAFLGQECMSRDMFDEAARLFQSCLAGPFEKDPAFRQRLVEALVAGGRYDEAADVLALLRDANPDHRANDCELLQARILEGQGRNDEALNLYRGLIGRFAGLEPRYRYGALLKKLGNDESSHQIFEEILTHARRYKSLPESEERWIKQTRRALSPG